jgi:hypothetical protein
MNLNKDLHGTNEYWRKGLDRVHASNEYFTVYNMCELLFAQINILTDACQPGTDVL